MRKSGRPEPTRTNNEHPPKPNDEKTVCLTCLSHPLFECNCSFRIHNENVGRLREKANSQSSLQSLQWLDARIFLRFMLDKR